MSENSGSNMCYDCEWRFVNSFAAYQHCRDVGHDQAWECDACDTYFDSEEDLDDHIEERHEEYSCENCNDGRTFYGSVSINQHNTAKHNHRCRDCSKTFATPASMEAHASACHNLTCAQCGQFFRHKDQFDKHRAAPQHAALIRKYEAKNKPAPKAQPLKCPFCSSTSFTTEKELVVHQAAHIIATETKKDPIVQAPARNTTVPTPSVQTSVKSPPGLFGQIRSYFGASTSTPPNPQGSIATSSGFGSIPGAFPATASSLSPRSLPECPGTGFVPFEAIVAIEPNSTSDQKSAFQSINFQTPYQNFSFEELRLADYSKGCNWWKPLTTAIKPPPGSVKCQRCPEISAKYFLSDKALEEHQWSAHTQSRLDEEKRKIVPPTLAQPSIQFDCDICGGNFRTMALLHDHKSQWHAVKCDECSGVVFDSAAGLKKHQKEVHLLPCTGYSNRFFHGLLAPAHSGLCLKCEMKTEGSATVDLLGLVDISDLNDLDNSNFCTAPNSTVTASSTRSSLSPEKPDITESKYCYMEVSTQTTTYKCDACVTTFENDEELQSHIKSSPFHEPRVLGCYECSLPFPDQISLLQHIESRPHKTRWILSML